jgi:hypothetical protein
MVEQKLIEVKDVLARPVQKKAKTFPGKLGESQIVVGLHLDLNNLLGTLQRFSRVPKRSRSDLHGPEGDRITALKLARTPGDRFGVEDGVSIDPISRCGDAFFYRLEFHHRHGRNGADVVGVEDMQQGFGYFGKTVVDFLMDPPAEKGKGLDQPLGMGIFAFIRFELETAGDFGILFGKFRPHLPHKGKFPFIKF